MGKRLETSLEQIIFILQEREEPVEYGRLVKTLSRRNVDRYYDFTFKMEKLKELGYIHENNALVRLTQMGNEFKGFGEIKCQKHLKEKENSLNLSNLELQNENLQRQSEIDQLTIENLRLKNRQLNRHVIFSIIGFLMGALLTSLKDMIGFFMSW